MFVLDCSATMACFFEDEATKETQALLDALADEEIAVVPSLWLLEVTNILLVGERRGRNTVEQTKEFWETLRALPIEIEEYSLEQCSSSISDLARTHNLSAYDASYLSLAKRRSLPLATLDKRLLAAAKACGVSLWTPNKNWDNSQ
ncbi:type II toxin-antitoxin system VapC family toxin [Candidatus Marithioploca araucensis]|uniref:Type II toxin-antitoxin system VapC family toxin n=1 Tax=Candidatus Marithioploca araucensis TaxID=70273 RepID=A0ABT7VS60_9GAMM|nr:type II toxin-antitoxin system VapC family toxin [Candidatus Marithioploca araucensis]